MMVQQLYIRMKRQVIVNTQEELILGNIYQYINQHQICIIMNATSVFLLIQFYRIIPQVWLKHKLTNRRLCIFKPQKGKDQLTNIFAYISKYQINYSLVEYQTLVGNKVQINLYEMGKAQKLNLLKLIKKVPNEFDFQGYLKIQENQIGKIKQEFSIITYEKKRFENVFKKILNKNNLNYMINRQRRQFIINQRSNIILEHIDKERIKFKFKIIAVTNYLKIQFQNREKYSFFIKFLKKTKFHGSIIYISKQKDLSDCIIQIDPSSKFDQNLQSYSFVSFKLLYYYFEFKAGPTRLLCDFIEYQAAQTDIKLYYRYDEESTIIDILDQKSQSQRIRQFIQILNKSDYAELSKYWNDYNNIIIRDINFIVDNWRVYVSKYEIMMEDFIKIINTRFMDVEQKSLQTVYKGISKLRNKILKKIELSQCKKIRGLEQLNTDILYQHFLQQLKSKQKKEGSYFIRDVKRDKKMPISQFIALSQDFFPRRYWQEIFFRDEIRFYSSEQKQFRKMYLNNITECKISNPKCLGCTQFFYQKQNIDNPDSHLNIAVLSSVQKINQLAVQIRDQICSFLNNGGGVVFFDCIQQYLNILVIGAYVTKNQMSRLQQIINGYIKDIYPPISVGNQLDISFVPIAKPPQFQRMKKEEVYETVNQQNTNQINPIFSNQIKINYLQGRFVLRIRVYASKSAKFYFWDNKDNKESRQQAIFVDKLKNRQIIKIKGEKIIKKMKKKFYTHYIRQTNNYSDESQRLLNFPDIQYQQINVLRCSKPQIGFPTTKQKTTDSLNTNQLQKKYKNMSLMIAKKKYHEEIKTKLKEKKIDCEIQSKFQQYKFKAAENSAILYHDMRFDHLLAQISYNKAFQFEGRYVMVILITPYIKLSERTLKNQMPKDDFESLKDWMANQFPKQALRMIRFQTENKEFEYYLESGSKTALLFMYYILNHYNQKAVFKNPKNYDKLSAEEKSKRFVEIHPQDKAQSKNICLQGLQKITKFTPTPIHKMIAKSKAKEFKKIITKSSLEEHKKVISKFKSNNITQKMSKSKFPKNQTAYTIQENQ